MCLATETIHQPPLFGSTYSQHAHAYQTHTHIHLHTPSSARVYSIYGLFCCFFPSCATHKWEKQRKLLCLPLNESICVCARVNEWNINLYGRILVFYAYSSYEFIVLNFVKWNWISLFLAASQITIECFFFSFLFSHMWLRKCVLCACDLYIYTHTLFIFQ